MSADTDYDYFSCYLDLLGYQKNEISDSVCTMLNVRSPLLVEGILLCTFALPTNNHDFKMFLRRFCQYPLHLEKFTLDVGTDTVVRCRIVYDTCNIVSKPLYRFSNRQFKNVNMLRKQLQGLTFTYKILKSHLFFEIMQLNGVGTDIQFHYNATKDCFATSPSGMDYSTFITRNKDKITSIKNYNLAIVPMPQSAAASDQARLFSQPAPDPSQANLSSVTQSSVAQAASLLAQAASLPATVANETFDNFKDTPRRHLQFPVRSLRRDLLSEIVDPELHSRPHPAGVSTRLDNKQTSANRKIITEIAQAKGLVCDSDMLEEMFQSKTAWNITKYGVLTLALHGVIPLVDRRLALTEDEEQEEEEDTLNKTISDLIQEKEVAKE
jgi:hypothetical protein